MDRSCAAAFVTMSQLLLICRGECIDGDARCGEWAAVGECKNNPAYMLNTCRKACKSCKESDKKASPA